MSTYYVGPSSAGSANGSSWSNRYGTLNAAEDTPVVAGDTVYVGPGVYRETLTLDVSGSSGSPITYIADVTGQQTDGVGGPVRITGSADDLVETRSTCITASARTFRTFRGFMLDTSSGNAINATSNPGNWIIEDCCVFAGGGDGIEFNGSGVSNTVRRCVIIGTGSATQMIQFTHSSTVSNAGHLIENCILMAHAGRGVDIIRVGGGTIKNCTFIGGARGVSVSTALAGGQDWDVNNCILTGCGTALIGTATSEIVEDYNTLYRNGTDRTTTNVGTNSVGYPALFQPPMMVDEFRFPWVFGALSHWSQVRAKAGTSQASEDMWGVARPATNAKISWGANQFVDGNRETTTVRTGAASIKLADAGRHQMFVPVTNTSTTISVYTQWEADYAGTKPQMVIKQPGVADRTTTATGSSGSWEQLTDTFTPAALPPYVIVELVSNNTAASTAFDVFFDDLTVS